MKHWITPLLAVFFLLSFSSCANHSEIIASGLSVELTKVERASSGTVEVTWQVGNPNVVTYVVDRVSHKVTLDGVEVGTLVDNNRFGVPKQNKETHTTVLQLANASAGERIAQAAARGSAEYRVQSTVWLLIVDDDLVKASLSNSGTVAVSAK